MEIVADDTGKPVNLLVILPEKDAVFANLSAS